ncbi:MAG: M73 family metallopeptidase, partial [Paenibacillaceae bacterium]|nr:M73 family metallopeptidase [Paenibacillaceae bacterium]
VDKLNDVIYETTLYDLQNQTPDAVERGFFLGERSGLRAGSTDTMIVDFEFVDNGQDQNQFQGDALNLKWTFEAKQGAGDVR